MSRLGRVARGLGAAAATLAMVGVGAGLVVAGTRWPAGRPEPVPAVVVDVPADRTVLVCPGAPVLAPGSEGSSDPGFDPTPAEIATAVSAVSLGRDGSDAGAGRYLPSLRAGEGTPRPLAPASAPTATVRVLTGDEPGVVELDPVGDLAALGAAATISRTAAGDLRGLVGATCREAAASAWLVAGSTTVGSSSRLVLANPGGTPATVSLALWGPSGPLEVGQARTVLVPPGRQESVLLEAVAPDAARLGVHVTASGGQVAAWVQDSALHGFVPAGTDLVAPLAEPATTVVVPGLVLGESSVDDPEAALLRVLNPGAEPTSVRLRLLGHDGAVVVPGAETTVLEPGTVTDISLAGVPAGAYAAELAADAPVTAAGLLVRVGTPGPDDPDEPVVERAWTGAATPSPASVVMLPTVGRPAVVPTVLLTNPSGEEVTVRVQPVAVDGGLGEPVEVAVPAGATRPVGEDQAGGATALALTAPGEGVVAAVVASASADDGELLTVLGAQPDLATEQSVAVRLGQPPR